MVSVQGVLSTPAGFQSEAIDALLLRYRRDPHALVQILREAQAQHTWLPRWA